LKFSPRDSEAPIQLELSYQKLNSTLNWTPHTNGIQRLIYSVNSNVWSVGAICLSLLLSGLLFLLIRNKNASMKRLYFLFIIGGSILLLSFIISAKSSSDYLLSQSFAIVTKKSISVYINEKIEKKDMQLQEGTKVKLVNVSGSKTQIQLEDGMLLFV
jgi:hypothetical protein